jgi:hypothetical protein
MMKNYMTMGSFSKGKKPEGDLVGKAAAPFPKEKDVMSIYQPGSQHRKPGRPRIPSLVQVPDHF